LSSFWNFNIHEKKVFDFSKEPNENWIKVDSNESHLILLSIKKELVELLISMSLNSLLPMDDLLLVVLLQVLAKRNVKLLDIFELLSVLD